jgi:hypothetical protein
MSAWHSLSGLSACEQHEMLRPYATSPVRASVRMRENLSTFAALGKAKTKINLF